MLNNDAMKQFIQERRKLVISMIENPNTKHDLLPLGDGYSLKFVNFSNNNGMELRLIKDMTFSDGVYPVEMMIEFVESPTKPIPFSIINPGYVDRLFGVYMDYLTSNERSTLLDIYKTLELIEPSLLHYGYKETIEKGETNHGFEYNGKETIYRLNSYGDDALLLRLLVKTEEREV